jgi:hypothetical protein
MDAHLINGSLLLRCIQHLGFDALKDMTRVRSSCDPRFEAMPLLGNHGGCPRSKNVMLSVLPGIGTVL